MAPSSPPALGIDSSVMESHAQPAFATTIRRAEEAAIRARELIERTAELLCQTCAITITTIRSPWDGKKPATQS